MVDVPSTVCFQTILFFTLSYNVLIMAQRKTILSKNTYKLLCKRVETKMCIKDFFIYLNREQEAFVVTLFAC